MPRGLDHVVHAVRDLEAAGEFYTRLGFTVSGRNRHPFGTNNRAVQLDRFYIEVLTVAEPEKVVPHDGRAFSFSAYQRDYLAQRQGLSMLMLNSDDAIADAAAYRAAGAGDFETLDFGRDGLRADGTPVKLAFTLAFACESSSPLAGFGACQHHFPENFWSDAAQRHANGATDVVGAVLVADNPSDHHVFLQSYTGLRDLHSSSLGISAQTERGAIGIFTPAAFRDQFGVATETIGKAASIAALRLAVADLAATTALLRQNGVSAELRVGRLVVPPQAAFGATLVFEQRPEA